MRACINHNPLLYAYVCWNYWWNALVLSLYWTLGKEKVTFNIFGYSDWRTQSHYVERILQVDPPHYMRYSADFLRLWKCISIRVLLCYWGCGRRVEDNLHQRPQRHLWIRHGHWRPCFLLHQRLGHYLPLRFPHPCSHHHYCSHLYDRRNSNEYVGVDVRWENFGASAKNSRHKRQIVYYNYWGNQSLKVGLSVFGGPRCTSILYHHRPFWLQITEKNHRSSYGVQLHC